MPLYQDDFTRSVYPAPLAGTPMPQGGPAYVEVGGTWVSSSPGRPTTTAAGSSSPRLLVAEGAGSVDETIAVSSQGGDALYCRDATSTGFIRARVRRFQTSDSYTVPPTFTTYYTWRGTYTHISHSFPSGGVDSIYKYRDDENTSNTSTANPQSSSFSHVHGGVTTHSHSWDLFRSSVVSQREVQTGGGGTQSFTVNNYQVVLEKIVNGAVTQIGATPATTSASITSLRLRGEGPSIQVFINGSTSPAISVTETFNQTVNRHGFGLAPSDVSGASGLDNFSINTLNAPPGAPLLTFPAVGQIVNRTVPNQLRQTFNDVDGGDSRSKLEQRWRVAVPAGQTVNAWNVVAQSGASNFVEYPANTFPLGTIEWGGHDADASGTFGDWSANASFVSANPPPGPVPSQPIAGSVVPGATSELKWTSTNQAAFRVRIVRQGGTTFDSGIVQGSTTLFNLTHPFNNTTETVYLSTYSAEGLQSAEASVPYSVAYTPPSKARSLITVDSGKGGLQVQILNPAGSPTAVASNTVWVRETLDPEEEWPGARDVAPNGFWTYLAPGSETEYEFRVDAVGANGTTRIGDWNGAIAQAVGITEPNAPVDGLPSYGSGTYGSGTYNE